MHPRRLYGHRGAAAERPENTMPSFERAIECGVDVLEMDVHLTRDAQLIVVHDDTAARTTGAPLAWGDLDLEDAQHLDAGWGFVAPDGTRPFAGQGIHVPTFEEVLVTFRDVPINVDIKGERPRVKDGSGPASGPGRILDVMLDLVRRMKAEERVTLASFQLRTLVEVRRRGYAGPTSLSQSEVATLLALPGMLWRQLPLTGTAAQVPTHQGPIRFDRAAFIAKCHSLGLRVDFWTVDDRDEAKRLLDLGADGIITNDPAALRPLFA